MKSVETAEQAKQDTAYLKALTELLYQLADDDFIISFRGSEWLGLAPHIEEDVAFSSITQNTMGHAYLFYNLLEELGEGNADVLAHERKAHERRNAIYLEKRNGDGDYLAEPYYDWALTVVRHYFYEVFKKVKLEAVSKSSYVPLANIAEKVLMEQTYHLAHWRLWFKQLQASTEAAQERIKKRVDEAWEQFGDAFDLGACEGDLETYKLVSSGECLKERWLREVKSVIISPPTTALGKVLGNGRKGEHTVDLDQAIETLSEVYSSDPKAVW